MKDDLEKFIDENKEQLDWRKPNPEVFARIVSQMHVKQKEQPKGILIPFRVLQWAAVGLLLIGVGVAFWSIQKPSVSVSETVRVISRQKTDIIPQTGNNAESETNAKTVSNGRASIDSVDNALAARRAQLYTRAKVKSQQRSKLALFASLNNMDSPAARINATSQINRLNNAGKDVVDALIQTLNNDPNANVRIAALDGLAKFYRDSYVRQKLIVSLKKQHDPVVQIAMIELLTRMKESAILAELDKLVDDDATLKAVKDCAYSSMFRLRSS